MKKIYIFMGLIVCAMFCLVFLSNLRSSVYDTQWYLVEFNETGVYETFSEEEAVVAVQDLHGYFRGKGELDDFWNEKEKSHLSDVKGLVKKGTYWYWGLLIGCVVLFYLLFRTDSIGYLKNISIVFLIVGALTGLFELLLLFVSKNFNSVFVGFHEMFFPQGNYMFSSGNMVKLFPEQFFMDITMKILEDSFRSGVLLLVLGVIGVVYFHYRKKKVEK